MGRRRRYIGHIPVILVLLYLTYTDIKRREIPNFAVVALLIYSLFCCNNILELKASLIIGGIVFLFSFLSSLITKGGIGGGDIKLMAVLAFLLREKFFTLLFPLAIILFVAFIFFVVIKKEGLRYSAPLAPYVFASYLCFVLGIGA